MRDRIDEAVAALGIEPLRGRSLSTLSGGERQRVALAAVLVLRPSLLALDEPTSQLDPVGAAAVLASCRDLAARGHAVVVAEHRLETIGPAANRVVRLEHGRASTADGPLRSPVPPVSSAASRRAPRAGAEPAWELRDVSAGPAAEAILTGVNLAGARGEVTAIAGPNGSGKTTLLRTIAGLLAPLSGSVTRPGGRTAYLPQNPGALLHLPTVRAEVELTLRRTGSSDSAEPLLEAMGLAGLADRYPRDLSSGQRQRAALAAVLAGSPDLVLLDEPTRGMDAAARAALAGAVGDLTSRGSSVVLATHDSQLIAAIASHVVELSGGQAVERPRAATSARPEAAR
jgi:energy-coupling factor transport system ATP-binding protein